jgi:hypothetical protein
MMFRWVTPFVLLGVLAGGCAHAAELSTVKFDLSRGALMATTTELRADDRRTIFDGEDWSPAPPEAIKADYPPNAATVATSRAVAVSMPGGVPVDLRIQALSGHRAFATLQARRATLGWNLTNSGNALGVGMTGTYGIRLTKGWRMTPFFSLDYNRVDSARYVDATGPNPYLYDNADSGLTGTIGTTISHRFGAEQRFRALAFGALVAAGTQEAPREFGSLGARFVHAIGDSAIKSVWQEAGFGLDYRLTPKARLTGAVVQTLDRADGDTVAAKFGLRVAL